MGEIKMVRLVAARFKGDERSYLFEAPCSQYIRPGETVVVDTEDGEQEAIAAVSDTFIAGSASWEFIIRAFGAELPLQRIKQRIVKYEMAYPEEGAENAENDDRTPTDNEEKLAEDFD